MKEVNVIDELVEFIITHPILYESNQSVKLLKEKLKHFNEAICFVLRHQITISSAKNLL